jgi:sensor histidine kinase YesM
VRFDTDPEALDALVPTLVLQPLVENAVRHAIEPRAAAGRLEIRARRHDGRLTLEVADDGPGIATNGHASRRLGDSGHWLGIGLANTMPGWSSLRRGHRHLANAEGGPW